MSNSPTPKNPGIENCKLKKTFNHPRHLKSGVHPLRASSHRPSHLKVQRANHYTNAPQGERKGRNYSRLRKITPFLPPLSSLATKAIYVIGVA